MTNSIVSVQNLEITYPAGRSGFWGKLGHVQAVSGVSFDVAPGETLGLVGESGSGKTTIGRAILGRVPVASGSVFFRGKDITATRGNERRRLGRHIQQVFQDPYASLNPRMRILDIVAEPLIVHGIARSAEGARDRAVQLLSLTGLPPDAAERYPHAFSGGQRQRIGIARALAVGPEFVVLDEPVAALDMSIQAQIVNLLQDLQDRLGLSYLFISHDLAVVRHISDRIAIMYAGTLVEVSDRNSIYERPAHPYTRALLSAVPVADPHSCAKRRRIVLQGEIPDPLDPPTGCRFHSRCPYRQPERCVDEVPDLREVEPGRHVACHYVEAIRSGRISAFPSAVSVQLGRSPPLHHYT